MKGVVTIGEVLIDFIPMDQENSAYIKNPGGAPANVAVGVAKLGGEASFVGTVGGDLFGDYLIQVLKSYDVSTEYIQKTTQAKTQVVFVNNDESGERSFVFYNDKGADQFLHVDHINESIFDSQYALHLGSISLIQEPTKTAVKKAVDCAREKGNYISFDPNVRINMWDSTDHAKQEIASILPKTDILKISEEELEFITDEQDIYKALASLEEFDIPLVLITFGAKGSGFYYNNQLTIVEGIKIKAVDTTGAGDAFMSAVLYQLSKDECLLDQLSDSKLKNILRFANISGGITASSKGAIHSLPNLRDVEKYF
ncbi:carbohydrate kinase family protein [Vallitalea okinawensis]|uniref:carbohydrate kinase family protein n=1 Tax=Vallitalea okinawensis TaxID=2078660 RepID=UPI000CFCE1B0|nr:carbohydrate kinase [Vallitalea okinawensis]